MKDLIEGPESKALRDYANRVTRDMEKIVKDAKLKAKVRHPAHDRIKQYEETVKGLREIGVYGTIEQKLDRATEDLEEAVNLLKRFEAEKTEADILAGIGQTKYSALTFFILATATNQEMMQKNLQSTIAEALALDVKTVQNGLRNAAKVEIFEISQEGKERRWSLKGGILEVEAVLNRVTVLIDEALKGKQYTAKDLKGKVEIQNTTIANLERGLEEVTEERDKLKELLNDLSKFTKDKFELARSLNDITPAIRALNQNMKKQLDKDLQAAPKDPEEL